MSSKFCALVVMLALVALAVSGCTLPLGERQALKGSGNVVAREGSVSGFDQVKVSHAFRANIKQGETFSVIVRIDDNLVKYLEVAKRGRTLVIGLEPDMSFSLEAVTMEAEISMPYLNGLDLNGASRVTIGGFRSDKDLDVKLSGAGKLQGNIQAGDIRFDISGAGRATLRGSADDLRVDASGASKVDLGALEVGQAEVGASGASEVTVNVEGQLDVMASGSSRVHYFGSPTLETVSTSGGASVEKS